MSYGIIKLNDSKQLVYRAKVPNVKKEDGYIHKRFSSTEYKDPLHSAKQWQHEKGVEIWGETRWSMVKSGGKTTRLRSGSGSVSVRKSKNTYTLVTGEVITYFYYSVVWKTEGGREKTKTFNEKRYGDKALEAAELFACQKRAENTGGELNLPVSILVS